MDINCNVDDLEIRKYPNGDLPLDSCRECLFNVMCLDYSTYEGDLDPKEKDQGEK